MKARYSSEVICITSNDPHIVFQSNSRNKNIDLSNQLSPFVESWGRSLVYKFLMPRFIGDTGYWLNGLRPTFKEWFIGFD